MVYLRAEHQEPDRDDLLLTLRRLAKDARAEFRSVEDGLTYSQDGLQIVAFEATAELPGVIVVAGPLAHVRWCWTHLIGSDLPLREVILTDSEFLELRNRLLEDLAPAEEGARFGVGSRMLVSHDHPLVVAGFADSVAESGLVDIEVASLPTKPTAATERRVEQALRIVLSSEI